jgi:hypothetical protein
MFCYMYMKVSTEPEELIKKMVGRKGELHAGYIPENIELLLLVWRRR